MAHAFESLTPDVVLDALDSVGLRGDGRLTALSPTKTASTRCNWKTAVPWWPSFTAPSAGATRRFWKNTPFPPN
jgi:hypothetical protein